MAYGSLSSGSSVHHRKLNSQNVECQLRSATHNLYGKVLGHMAFAITGLIFPQSYVQALYNLATMPEYADPLREAIETRLGTDPSMWTKEVFGRCWKLDSFLKESQRLNGLGACTFIDLFLP